MGESLIRVHPQLSSKTLSSGERVNRQARDVKQALAGRQPSVEIRERDLGFMHHHPPSLGDRLNILRLRCSFLEGKDWNYHRSTNVVKHVYAKHLHPWARFWAQFIMHNIYPQSHEYECKPPILRIVYGIFSNLEVDAAWIMSEYIFHIAREFAPGTFGLPWLITRLCEDAGVLFGDDLCDLKRQAQMGSQKLQTFDGIAREELGLPPLEAARGSRAARAAAAAATPSVPPAPAPAAPVVPPIPDPQPSQGGSTADLTRE
ncbi:hypothetical protein RIF29_24015 [Crotalaria pallida]|uniref:Putative plant transposon protein domain-containing protein n=1 Tax=Crotalaria pallida TaxID=3830 RepID=A0AAN9ER45_CROPI